MNLLLIIGIVVALLLAVVGTVNRKIIGTWFKAEASEFIENNIDQLKLAKQKIKDAETLRITIVDQAGSLLAEEEIQDKALIKLNQKLETAKENAVIAKKENNKTLALIRLKERKQLETQIEIITENIKVLRDTRCKLENTNESLKVKVFNYKTQLSGLEARKATNNALDKINFGSYRGGNINESLESEDIKISKDEIKLKYKMDVEDIDDDEVATEDLEEEYEKL